jgi:predicted Co/Zn/Cd cation transporter (cation efflux family)
LHSAVTALFTGGRDIDTSVATLFGVVNVVGCGYAWWFIASRSRSFSSGLVEAEAKQWQMDTLLSVAVTVGFIIAWIVTLSPLAEYAVYADPLMMCVMSVYFIKVPFDMLCGAVRELLMMSPAEDIRSQVGAGVVAVNKEARQQLELAGVIKVGRELRVNIDMHTESNSVIAVDDIERTRRSLTRCLSTLPFDLQLNLNIAR